MALLFPIFVIVLALCSFLVTSHASVLGIDFGSEYMKVALVQPGTPFEIVTNMQSKRKTRTCLYFKSTGDYLERQFGDDAYQFLGKKPESTFCKFNRLIGKQQNVDNTTEDVFSRLKSRDFFPYHFTRTSESDRTAFLVNDKYKMEAEELYAMLLEHVKLFSSNFGAKNIKDIVLTIPSYYTQHEKLALIAAAEIADLKVLALIEENTAAALHYSIDRAHTLEAPQNILFYNLGSDTLQVTIANFSATTVLEGGKDKPIGQFEVIGKAWDDSLGGFQFDMSLTNWLAEKFNAGWCAKKKDKCSRDIRTEPKNERVMARLKLEASKLKETLSANDNFPSKVDQLYDDFDLNTKISRQEFEEYIKDSLLSRLFEPIDKALKMAKIDKSSIAAIELLGGGIRVPKVKELLNAYFSDVNKTCSQHINGDESMALGAAFRGAQLKTTFRVRKIESKDFSPYSVSVSLKSLEDVEDTNKINAENEEEKKVVSESEPWSKESKLYQSGVKSSFYGKKITVSVPHSKDMSCTLFYDNKDEANMNLPSSTHETVASYSLTGITAFASDLEAKTKEFAFLEKGNYNVTSPKVTLSFLLDPSTGVYSLAKADVFVETTEIVEEKPVVTSASETAVEEAVPVPSGDAAVPAGGDAAAAAVDSTNNSTDDASAADSSNSTTTESPASTTKAAEATSTTPPPPPVAKKPIAFKKSRSLTINEIHHAMNPDTWTLDQIATKRSFIDSLDAADNDRRMKDAAMNDLETYGYATKNRLEDDSSLKTVSTEEQREQLRNAVQAEIDWLEETGSNAETQVYKDRLASVTNMATAIYLRLTELTSRPEEVKKARNKINIIRTTVADWTEEKPQVTEEEKTSLLDLVAKAESWLDEKVEVQSLRAAHEDLAFLSTDIKPMLKDASVKFDKLSKKKPLPPPVVNNSTNSSGTSNSSDTSTTNSTEKVNINPENTEAPVSDDADGEKKDESTTSSDTDAKTEASSDEL